MDTRGTGHGGESGYGILHLFAGSKDYVGKLINDEHNVRHEFVLVGIQAPCYEFLVVFLDIAYFGFLEEFKAVFHLDAEGIQYAYHFRRIRDYGVFAGKRSKIVPFELAVQAELYTLRVDQHEFQFCRMLLKQKRGYYGVETY